MKQLTKHQQVCTTEENEEKQFVLPLTLSKNKNMVLRLFKGNVYAHFWDNRNKKHVSLNCNELTCFLTIGCNWRNYRTIEDGRQTVDFPLIDVNI